MPPPTTCAGVLPFRIGEETGYRTGGEEAFRTRILDPDHPIFRDLDQDQYREILQGLPIYRLLPPADGSMVTAEDLRDAAQRPGADPEAVDQEAIDAAPRVLARLTDALESPLLVAARFGEGKVLALTSAFSMRPDRWNRLDFPIVAFPWLHSTAEWLALPANDPFNTGVGAVLTCSLKSRPTEVAMTLPERAGGGKAPVGTESRALPGGRYTLPAWTRTAFAGVYRFDVTLEDGANREQTELPFAVQPDPKEGDLTYASHTATAAALGLEQIYTALPSGGGTTASGRGGDFGPFLLYTLLAVLLGEAAMARFVSRRRAG